MSRIASRVAIALGISMLPVILVINILPIPLSMVTVMHLTGDGIWKALLTIFIISCIPLVGDLFSVIAPFVGAFFLWQADFDIDVATTKIFNAEKVTAGIESECLKGAKVHFEFVGDPPMEVVNWCRCYSKTFVRNLPTEERKLFFSKKRDKATLDKRRDTALKECLI